MIRSVLVWCIVLCKCVAHNIPLTDETDLFAWIAVVRRGESSIQRLEAEYTPQIREGDSVMTNREYILHTLGDLKSTMVDRAQFQRFLADLPAVVSQWRPYIVYYGGLTWKDDGEHHVTTTFVDVVGTTTVNVTTSWWEWIVRGLIRLIFLR